MTAHDRHRIHAALAIAVVLAVGTLARPPAAGAQNMGEAIAAALQNAEVVDLTVLISEQLPAHWPTHAPFQRWTFNWFKPVKGAYGDNLAQSVFRTTASATSSTSIPGPSSTARRTSSRPRGAGCPSRARWAR